MNPDPAHRLAALLARLRAEATDPTADPAPPSDAQRVQEFVRSFFVWEAGEHRARAALDAIAASLVDFNELRVCLPAELAGIVGEPYPLLLERCQRLRASLNDVFRREHSVSLEGPAQMGKREVRAYLGGLEGMPAFVADRLTLLVFGGHAFPVDARLAAALAGAGIADAAAEPAHVASWMERHIHAGEAVAAYRLVEQWAQSAPAEPPRLRRPRTRKKPDDP